MKAHRAIESAQPERALLAGFFVSERTGVTMGIIHLSYVHKKLDHWGSVASKVSQANCPECLAEYEIWKKERAEETVRADAEKAKKAERSAAGLCPECGSGNIHKEKGGNKWFTTEKTVCENGHIIDSEVVSETIPGWIERNGTGHEGKAGSKGDDYAITPGGRGYD